MRKYSDEGRESAKVLLADMLMYGLGVEQDVKTAREMFGALAEGGNVYAQFVMIQSRLAPVAQAVPVAQAPAKPKMYTPQELEALGVQNFAPTGVVPGNVSLSVVFRQTE